MLEQIHGDFGDPWTYGGAWLDGDRTIYTRGRESEDPDASADDDDDPAATVTVYRWSNDDDFGPDDWTASSIDRACRCIDMERADFDALPVHDKWLVLAEYVGPDELDCYPYKATRAELSRWIQDPDL